MNVGTRSSDGDHREALHHLVLVVRDLSLEVVADPRQRVASGVEPFRRAQQLVERAAEGDLDVAGEELTSSSSMRLSTIFRTASRVGASVLRTWSMSCRRPRMRRPISPGVLSATRSSSSSISSSSASITSRNFSATSSIEVVGVHPDVLVRAAGLLRRRRVERLLARRRLRHRHRHVHRRDEVDLLVVQAVFGRHLDGKQQDAEHVVAVRLDSRSRLVVVLMRREERFERRRVDVRGQRVAELGRLRVDQVDPLGHIRRLRPSPDV